MSTKTITKAVLPVAGFGTRVLPATKAIPKELLPVFDRPALQYVIDEALEAGISHFVFVTGRNKSSIEDYFDTAFELEASLIERSKTDIYNALQASKLPAGSASFTRQQAPLGLGHAILCAKDIIGNEPFAVLLPDVLIRGETSATKQMIEAYETYGGNIIAVDAVPADQVQKYGVVDPVSGIDSDLFEIDGMVEKPNPDVAPSNFKITGRYVLQPEIFDVLQSQEPGVGGEIQLTDAMKTLMTQQPFHALKYKGEDFDCGDKLLYLRAFVSYALASEEMGAQAKQVISQLLEDR